MANYCYVSMWSLFLALGMFYFGYALNEIEIIWDMAPGIYGFDHTHRHEYNNFAAQITALVAAITALFNWYFVKMGKRRLLMLNGIIVLAATGVRMIHSFIALIVARGLLGIVTGISSGTVPLFIREISPVKYRGALIGLSQQFVTIGALGSLLMGMSLPRFHRRDGIEYCKPLEGEFIGWRYLFLFPAGVAVLQLLFLKFIFRKEQPSYYEDEVHKKIISAYRQMDGDNLQISTSINESGAFHQELYEEDTYANLWVLKNRRALFVGGMVHIFQQFSGINMVLLYSYHFIFSKENYQLNVRFIMVIINCLLTLLSLHFMTIFKRKPLFLVGYLIIGACNTLLFQVFDADPVESQREVFTLIAFIAIFIIAVFIISFSLTLGTLAWVYSAEVLTEKGMGIAVFCHWISNLVIYYLPDLAIKFEPTKESWEYLDSHTSVFFFLFSGMGMIAFFLTSLYLKETKDIETEKLNSLYESEVFYKVS